MTANPLPDPPILRLNQDLLWSIFALNAQMFSESALESEALRNTWSTSQVCKSWRDLMLATPSLWGRLIDLDAFSKSGKDWAHEVLRRSGIAPLWIRGYHIDIAPRHSHIFDIMDKYWYRIQRLVIHISPDGLKHIPPDQFYLPAPHLQIFELESWGQPREFQDVFDSWPTGSLFADNAPALRKFRFAEYKFNSQANWLSGLSSLHIGHPFSVEEVLLILQRTPNLHHLYVDSFADVIGTAQILSCVDVHLPSLNYCILYSDFKSSMGLLEHIDMPCDCHLRFRPDEFSVTDISRDFLKSSFKLLSMFAQRYLQSNHSKRLRLVLLHSIDCFSWSLRDDSPLDDHAFHIRVRMDPKVSPLIFDEFSFPQLSKVTELDLSLVDDLIPTKAILSIFFSLSSIESITLYPKTLRRLASLHRNIKQRGDTSPLIFPNLEIIKTTAKFECRDTSLLRKDDALHQLLKLRARRGHVVKVLDFRCSDAMHTPPLQYLEEMHGLHVFWTDEYSGRPLEYKCGGGHPERLPSSFCRR